MDSDLDLVRAARRGSAEAVEVLFSRYWVTAWQAAYAVGGRAELADDAAQDAFLTALRTLGRFELGRPFAPWIARIAVNRARDLMRAERRRERLAFRSVVVEDGFESESTEALSALAGLVPERREVVLLHHVHGFTLAEVAEILSLPAGTVASRLSRAVTELRQTVKAAHHA